MTTPLSSPNVPIHKTQRFEDFYRLFEEKPGIFKYQDQISDIFSKGGNTLLIYYEDLLAFDFQIAEMLRKDPESLLEDAIDAFKNILKFQGAKITDQYYFVRLTTKDEKSPLNIPLRGLRAKNIDNLVCSNGILVRSSAIRPKLVKATFECMICGAQFEVIQLTARIKWPKFCTNKRCKARAQSDFRLISKVSEFIDWQSIVIQEIPEDLPPGRIPRSVQAILTYDLVDSVKPGDRVKIMGIYKSVLAQSTKGMNSTLFKTYIDVNYIDPEDKSDELIDLSKEEKSEIEKLSKEPMIQKKIARSIAPAIYGREDLKMACALSLFAGTRKKKSGGGYKRGDIHVLFVGDPGTGKSEILKGAIEVSPRGLYTSGKGASAVGLTAAVIKDNETGQMNLEAGAVVLANGGVACLSGESMISFDNEIVRIKNLFDENLMFNAYSKGEQIEISNLEGKISSLNSNLDVINSKTSKIRRKMYNGKIFEIKFRSGYKIQLTPDHKLLDGNLLEWKQAQNFKKGDLVVAPLKLPINTTPIFILDIIPNNWLIILNRSQKLQLKKLIYKKYRTLTEFNQKYSVPRHFLSGGNQLKAEQMKRILRDLNIYDIWKYKTLKYGRTSSGEILKVDKITPELAYFLGFIFGDGYIKITSRRSTIEIKQSLKNENQIKKLREVFNEFSRRKLREYKKKESNKIEGRIVESECVSMRPDSNLIAYLYDYITRSNLKNLFKLPNESLKGFLAGCIDSDGCISIKHSKKGNNVYKTAHIEFLISNVDEENLAIMSALRRINCFGRLIRGYNISRIRITGREDVKTLIRELNKYSVKIKEIPYQKHLVSSFSDKVPKVPVSLLSKKIISTVNTTLLLKTGIWSVLHAYKNMQYQPSRKQLQKIKCILFESLDKDTLDYIDILTNRNYFLDEIIKMDMIESNQYVYDLYVPDLHNFVCNGIFVHNCIDEFDKMETADRSALHEAMEQQTVSIAKAGIVATLKAQTAIIAAANPRSGRYDRYKTPTQNIHLPPSLLSRFDLIFVVVDKPNPADDAQMAEFILRSAMVNPNAIDNEKEEDVAPIPAELLKKYIKHARKTCHPVLSDESKEKIKEFYLDLRGQYDSEDAIVSILARNLDALVRLTEAHAKMALRDIVLKEDVEEIIKLFKRYLKDTGYDETTGKIDMDRILVGQSRSSISKLDKLLTRLKEIFEENKWKALEKTNIIPILALEEELDEKWIKDALDELVREGTLYEPRTNMIKFTNKDE